MHREIPEAEFRAPVASTFAIVKLLEATDFQGGSCPEHGCCSWRLALLKQKAKPHGLEGVRSLLHKSLSPRCKYIVQNTLSCSLDLKELRTQLFGLLCWGFFSDLLIINFHNIVLHKYRITKCCSCANSENSRAEFPCTGRGDIRQI